jgi:site-specific DNA-methyltransferase (adenine-specific)
VKPTYQTADGAVQLWLGDCLAVLADLPAGSVDTVITDPPYGLEFMGKDWDHGVPGEHYWREVARVAKPGAMMLCFGGTRTFHRLTCAIEDAGWEIRDCLMWLHGQGFPKSHNISGAIDKALGHGNRGHRIAVANRHHPDGTLEPNGECLPAYEAKSEAAKVWNGWGTALKPAWEPIILAMKPLDGTFAQNALAHGVAGLHIDGARIAAPPWKKQQGDAGHGFKSGKFMGAMGLGEPTGIGELTQSNLGRWPANLVLSHTPECHCVGTKVVKPTRLPGGGNPHRHDTADYRFQNHNRNAINYADADGKETVEAWECSPDCPVRLLDEQSGDCSHERNGLRPLRRTKPSVTQSLGLGINNHVGPAGMAFGDSGGASRFFYCAKASRGERGQGNTHPTIKPLKLMEWLCRLTATPTGGTVLDPFLGSGTTALACLRTGRRCIGIERDPGYVAIAVKRIEAELNRAPLFDPPTPVQGELV